jgi:hypothetical protein
LPAIEFIPAWNVVTPPEEAAPEVATLSSIRSPWLDVLICAMANQIRSLGCGNQPDGQITSDFRNQCQAPL